MFVISRYPIEVWWNQYSAHVERFFVEIVHGLHFLEVGFVEFPLADNLAHYLYEKAVSLGSA